MRPERNNRIVGDDFLNRSCAFGGRLESILLGDPPQNPFSTVSVKTGNALTEQMFSASPPIVLQNSKAFGDVGRLVSFCRWASRSCVEIVAG
jgi:hypothetical protein